MAAATTPATDRNLTVDPANLAVDLGNPAVDPENPATEVDADDQGNTDALCTDTATETDTEADMDITEMEMDMDIGRRRIRRVVSRLVAVSNRLPVPIIS